MAGNNGQGSNWIRREKRHRIYARDHLTCLYCSATCEDKLLTLDHITSRELGGTNEATNLVTCCISCNASKQHKSIRQFLQYLRRAGANVAGIAARIRRQAKRALPAQA